MKKTPGIQHHRHGLQSLGKIGSSKSLSPPVPLPSLKRSSDDNSTIRKGFGGNTSWSSIVKNGKETNTSSHKASDNLDSVPSPGDVNDRPLEKGGKIQTWSAVVISGLKPATKQSQVPHGNCRPKSNSILKENIEDGSRGSLETIPNNASLVEHTLYTRQTAPFGSPLDNFLSYKRSPQSRSSEKSQVQRDGCQDTALSFIEDKSLSTKIATDSDSNGCRETENSLSAQPDLQSNEDKFTTENGTVVENTIAEEFMQEINLRPQSGFMAASKQRDSMKAPASVLHGSDEDRTLLCMPCDREGSNAPAFGYCTDCFEHLCQSCFSHHKKATPSRHHVLLDKDAMPCIQSNQVTEALTDQGEFETWCCKHKQKQLEYFCNDHGHLACSVCVILDHRNCNIGYIPDIAKNCIDSSEYYETLNRMETVMTQTDNIRKKTKEKVKLSNESLGNVIPDIKELREKLNNRLDEMETAVRIKSEEFCEENEKKLKKTEVTCNYIDRSVVGISNKVKQLKASNQADKLFIALLISEYVLKDHEANISKLKSDEDIHEYKFVTHQNLLCLLEGTESFGTISPK